MGECTWFKSTFCQSLDTPHIFGLRGSPPMLVLSVVLSSFIFPCLILSPLALFAEARVKWFEATLLSHHHHLHCCSLLALHYWTRCSTASGKHTSGRSHRIRISHSGQAAFKPGSHCLKQENDHISLCYKSLNWSWQPFYITDPEFRGPTLDQHKLIEPANPIKRANLGLIS